MALAEATRTGLLGRALTVGLRCNKANRCSTSMSLLHYTPPTPEGRVRTERGKTMCNVRCAMCDVLRVCSDLIHCTWHLALST